MEYVGELLFISAWIQIEEHFGFCLLSILMIIFTNFDPRIVQSVTE